MKIHDGFNKTEIAFRYYRITHPEREYTRDHALRQFRQDVSIDFEVLKKVVSRVVTENEKIIEKYYQLSLR